ncbi:TRAM domain-containing protein [Candidatus Woesearchaeota archaeon]|nr:TRAM domain-containing protein [Candidatus Woesearchaeota archaeon]
MYGRFNTTAAPVKEGEELDVKIIALGDKGDGIAKKDGFVIVVPGTQVNDEVRIKVTRVMRKVAFAEVVGQAEVSDEPADEESEEEPEAEEPEAEPADEESEEEPAEDSEDFGEDMEEEE